jgi:hypothetical protein
MPPKALPHHLGLREHILSFDKGCYIGQESINRIDVMGRVRKHLCGVVVDARLQPEDEHRVLVGDAPLGGFTSPIPLQNGSTLGLAVLKEPHNAPGTKVVVSGAPGRVVAMPHTAP